MTLVLAAVATDNSLFDDSKQSLTPVLATWSCHALQQAMSRTILSQEANFCSKVHGYTNILQYLFAIGSCFGCSVQ